MSAVMVPDFAAIEATVTAWPAHPKEWPGPLLDGARRCVAEMVEALQGGSQAEELVVLVRDDEAKASASALLGDRIRLLPGVYGDIWLRDTGPVFVRSDAGPVARCFHTNGWGGKYDFPDDHGLAARLAEAVGLPGDPRPWVLEGGAVDSDGLGTLLTTRQCLLNPNRNGPVAEPEVEGWLARDLGATTVIWLDRGLIGDHTDGHVDNLARFIAPGVVACTEPTAGDPNEEIHQAVRDTLASATDARGLPLRLVLLPSPGPVTGDDGQLLAASYLNFVIGRGAVVVPTYGTRDEQAIAALRPHFDRPVIGVRSDALLAGGGSFHCITKSVPRRLNS